MAARYRDHRNKCHKHFKKYPTIALARQNPYKHVSDQKQWDWLCDRFASEKFQVKISSKSCLVCFIMFNMILYFNIDTLILTFNHKATLNIEHWKQNEVTFYSSRWITVLCTTCGRIGKIKRNYVIFINAFKLLITVLHKWFNFIL